ncbi:MAG: GNAT family protein [Psychroserpens sp.]|uniref:GNAT family N-acetyltransferase n=1 Tax=Psychroserpens sp. TaxID=2020870 RepID=UPI003C778393
MLETERILLRPIEFEDSEQVFRYRSDSETNKYQGFVPKLIEEVNQFITKNPTEINQIGSWFQLVIIEKASHNIIGDIGIHFIGEDGYQSELGCTLCKEKQGKGFALEAMHITMEYLFNSLNKHKIIGSVDPMNKNSINLLKRLNFRKEAHFKKSLLINGEWVDDMTYAILKSDWNHTKELLI